MSDEQPEDVTTPETPDASPTPAIDVEQANGVLLTATQIAAIEALVRRERPHSLRDVAQKAGVPAQVLREAFEASDRIHADGYTDDDIRYAERVARLLDVYPLDVLVRSARVRQRSLSSIVINDLVLSRDMLVQRPAVGQDADEAAMEQLESLPILTSLLADDYLNILRQLLATDIVQAAARTGEREITMAVGFVDVVGYTALSSQIDPAGLVEVLEDFEQLVHEVVGRYDDLLLAKFIGDAAMVVGSDVGNLADALLDIVADRGRLGEAPRRAGLARGPLVVRDGDYFGQPTNLAARLTDHAEPWSLLAAEGLDEQLKDGFDVKKTKSMKLRGIGDHRPLRIRRSEGKDRPSG